MCIQGRWGDLRNNYRRYIFHKQFIFEQSDEHYIRYIYVVIIPGNVLHARVQKCNDKGVHRNGGRNTTSNAFVWDMMNTREI